MLVPMMLLVVIMLLVTMMLLVAIMLLIVLAIFKVRVVVFMARMVMLVAAWAVGQHLASHVGALRVRMIKTGRHVAGLTLVDPYFQRHLIGHVTSLKIDITNSLRAC